MWTHLLCEACWLKRNPFEAPARLRDDPLRPCCECGKPTESGIYVRGIGLACGGKGPVHEGD